jgi:hypothetical protein
MFCPPHYSFRGTASIIRANGIELPTFIKDEKFLNHLKLKLV